jgi:hypothetical protein
MLKTLAFLGLVAQLAASPDMALAQQGTSQSWGTEGWGPRIPTISLSGRDRYWNYTHESQYRAEDGAEWIRLHSQGWPH